MGGYGGVVEVNATGVVDVQGGGNHNLAAIIDTSGKVIGSFDTNLINIEGGMVNIDGVLRADGVFNPENHNNVAYDPEAASRGGTIRLVAAGMTDGDCAACAIQSVSNVADETTGVVNLFDETESGELIANNFNLIDLYDGSININGCVFANGSAGYAANNNEGSYDNNVRLLSVQDDVNYRGSRAGDGGSILMTAFNKILNNGQIQANGGGHQGLLNPELANFSGVNGGNGGTISLLANSIENTSLGIIEANGGHGGNGNDLGFGVSNPNGSITAYTGVTAPPFIVDEILTELSGTPVTLPKLGIVTQISSASGTTNNPNGASGGSGGLIALGYKDTAVNDGVINANGGHGGSGGFSNVDATADTADAPTYLDLFAYANAYAKGGSGGNGGDGGLVVFSGPGNPTGDGVINAVGGDGGGGGSSEVTATATATGIIMAVANAYAEAGDGGNGGNGGNIVTPDPDTFSIVYNTNGGASGVSGTATATANAYSVVQALANAEAVTGDNGISNANANASGFDKTAASVLAASNAKATSGDNGEANAEAFTNSIVDASSTAEATAGNNGKATSNALANGKVITYTDSTAITGNDGWSTAFANSDATGLEGVAVIETSTATAISGDRGLAGAQAVANGYVLPTASANAHTGFDGRSDANAFSNSWALFGISEANASFMNEGKAVARATSQGNIPFFSDATTNAFDSVDNVPQDFKTGGGSPDITLLSEVQTAGFTDNVGPKAGGASGSDGADGGLLQTQDHELLSHNENLISLNRGGEETLLSGHLNAATPRTVKNQDNAPGAIAEISIKDFMGDYENFMFLNSVPGQSLTLDHPSQFSDGNSFTPETFDNLNTLTVMNHGDINNHELWVTGADSMGANQIGSGHLALLAMGDIYNDSFLRTQGPFSGGSIVLKAAPNEASGSNGTIWNDGFIQSTPLLSQYGGSIYLNAVDIVNNNLINADGTLGGGSVTLLAQNNIINTDTGYVGANGLGSSGSLITGGFIKSKAQNEANLNFGIYQANGINFGTGLKAAGFTRGDVYVPTYSGGGRGGYIHLHGGGVAANIDPSLLDGPATPSFMEAIGSTKGGQLLLTAGGGDASSFLSSLPTIDGFSVQTLTPPLTQLLTTIDLTVNESAYNFGNMRAQGGSIGGDGNIYLAGNGQVGTIEGATFHDVPVQYNNIVNAADPDAELQSLMGQIQNNGGNAYFVAGQAITGSDGVVRSAVEAVACDAAPNNDEPDVNPNDPTHQGSEFPDDFTLAAVPPPPVVNNDPDVNLLGLFQQQRPRVPRNNNYKAILTFANSNLFLLKGFENVTQDMLENAQLELNRQLANGVAPAEAKRLAQIYLAETGIDQETAVALVEQIEQGNFNADAKIVEVLETIAASTPEEPPVDTTLRQ
ncbi:MAG: hypothetical protein KTR14_07175 [Vampirovibrio sp.]|nr:hypothetical protein [Vampirovibrio sp.]